MKPRIATTVVALALIVGVSARAEFADPLDTPATQSALAPKGLFNGLAKAGTRWVAVGQRGHIVWSDDEGASWIQSRVPVRSDLTAVHFPSAQKGWAVGHDGVVLATSDAGATWRKQLDGRAIGALLVRYYAEHVPEGLDEDALAAVRADAQRFADEGPDKPFLDVWFEDERHGFVVGAFNLMLETRDGGQTWSPWLHRTDNPRAFHIYALRAVGDDLWAAGEQGLLMKLDRSAQRFRAVDLPYRGTLFGVAGEGGALIAYGLRGNAFRSTDGGASWTQVETGASASLTASGTTKEGDLVLMSQTGHVLVSNDGGASFAPAAPDRRVPASAAAVLANGSLLIGGPAGLQKISLENSR